MSIQVSGYDLTNFDEFVKACRAVLEFFGTPNVHPKHDKSSYLVDGGLTLVSDDGTDLLVRYSFYRTNGLRPLINPVISIDAKGEVVRAHGEWTYGQARIAAYLLRMQNTFHDKQTIKRVTADEFKDATLYSHYALEGRA